MFKFNAKTNDIEHEN